MAADLQPVLLGAQMIGVVDHPGGEPEHLALEGGEERQAGIGHDAVPGGTIIKIAERSWRFWSILTIQDEDFSDSRLDAGIFWSI